MSSAVPNFKVLSDDINEPQKHYNYETTLSSNYNQSGQPVTRSVEYHQYPMEKAGMPQFQHVLKRTGKPNRLAEIFGEGQDFSRMNQIEYNEMSGSKIPTNTQSYYVSAGQANSNHQQYETAPIMTGDSKKNNVYSAVSSFFPGFVMTKIRNIGQYSIYKAVVQCLLCDGVRYLVVITKNDNSRPGTKIPLENLQWESFQTRFDENDQEVKEFNILAFPHNQPSKSILADRITLSSKSPKSNHYICDTLPLKVEILKEKEDEFLSDTGTVISALNIYNTIITFYG